MSASDTLDFKNPKVIAAAVLGFIAISLGVYNCSGSATPEPEGADTKNEAILRAAAERLLAAVKAGGKPTKGSELPAAPGGVSDPNDSFGHELLVELTPAGGKNYSFVIRSAGKDGQAGTDDDVRAESTILHQGPAADDFRLGIVVISVGK